MGVVEVDGGREESQRLSDPGWTHGPSIHGVVGIWN